MILLDPKPLKDKEKQTQLPFDIINKDFVYIIYKKYEKQHINIRE